MAVDQKLIDQLKGLTVFTWRHGSKNVAITSLETSHIANIAKMMNRNYIFQTNLNLQLVRAYKAYYPIFYEGLHRMATFFSHVARPIASIEGEEFKEYRDFINLTLSSLRGEIIAPSVKSIETVETVVEEIPPINLFKLDL